MKLLHRWNVTTTADESWADTGPAYRDSTTSATLQLDLFGTPASDARPSCPAVSRASRSVAPGSDEARTMTVSSGLRCAGSCRSSGPLGCLEKTLLGSSTWNSTRRLLIWSVKDTPRGRSYFRLAASTPRIPGFDASLLPTPNAHGGHNSGRLDEWGGSNNMFRGTEIGRMPLNPGLVEWMMGFPEGWTDLER